MKTVFGLPGVVGIVGTRGGGGLVGGTETGQQGLLSNVKEKSCFCGPLIKQVYSMSM